MSNCVVRLNCTVSENCIRIQWDLSQPSKVLLQQAKVTVSYPFHVNSKGVSLGNLIGSTILGRFLSAEFETVEVTLVASSSEGVGRLIESAVPSNVSIFGDFSESETFSSPIGGRVGLLLGGGIESTFAAMRLKDQQPVLLQVQGPHWMNADYAKFKHKEELEDQFAEALGCELVRVYTDIKRAFLDQEDLDEQINRIVTGLLFYFLCLPVSDVKGLSFIVKSSELEEALNFSEFDKSLNPRDWASPIRQTNWPIALSPFSSFPKIFMLEEILGNLGREFFSSCLNNSEARWCGICSKCVRVHQMCQVIGFDPAEIDLAVKTPKPSLESGYKQNYRLFNELWLLLNQGGSKRKGPRKWNVNFGLEK